MGTLAFGGAMALGLGSASADSYTVKSGDTLNAISDSFNTDVDTLIKLNNIADKNLIYVGDTLTISASNVYVAEQVAPVINAPKVTTNQVTPSTPTTTSSAKEWIAQRESGGSYTARNGKYVGRYQLTDSYLNGDYSPENQERVADAYVSKRYGGWEQARQAWIAQGWY